MMRDERGIAMASTIGIGAVIVLLLGTLMVRNLSDLNQVRQDRLREQALHTGDAGIDQTLAFLTQNRFFNSGIALPPEATSWTAQQERDWVLAEAEKATAVVRRGREGEWVVVKPQPDPSLPVVVKEAASRCPIDDPSRDASCVVYSVGFTPERDLNRRVKIRIIKADYALGPQFVAGKAVLANGDLKLRGNLTVTGALGDAHANLSVSIQGSPSISGTLSAAGTCTGCGNVDGDPDPAPRGGRPPEKIPTVNTRQAYALSEYDLCPDKKVRAGPSHASAPPEGFTQPCSATAPVLADVTVAPFRGWTVTSQTDSRGPVWKYSAGGHLVECGKTECDGVYYAYQGSFDISGQPGAAGAPWLVTLLAEASPTSGPQPHTHCPHTYGDISFSGKPRIRYYDPANNGNRLLPGAGRDMQISGNVVAGQFDHQGAILAHGQIKMTGTPGIQGSVIANDTCPGGATIVGESSGIADEIFNPTTLTGNVKIHYDVPLTLPFGTDVHLLNWTEL